MLSLPGGGSLLFPQGAYDVSEIDATNDDPTQFYKILKLKGSGPFATKIRSATSNRILLNAIGRNNMHVEDMQFLSLRFQSQAAIYLCRSEKSPNCNNNKFENLSISGNYSKSSIISIGAESTSWSRCRFENSNKINKHICFFTSHDCDSIELSYNLPHKKISGPNTDNSMVDCEFYVPFDNATPLIFSGSAAFGLHLCTIICGDSSRTKLVTYRPSGDIFTGPVTWINPHFEVIGNDNC
ncbi:MAG: hypothetical protein JZU55_20195, partial [Afipia sp.]|nr:hypothetical protein [Afipia sp.]